jgi:hypothetical protein
MPELPSITDVAKSDTFKSALTPEEEALIPYYRDKHIKLQTTQSSYKDIKNIVNIIWGMCKWPKPTVLLCDSPIACRKRCIKEYGNDKNFDIYWSIWFAEYLATYDYAQNVCGIKLDTNKYILFEAWTLGCPFVLFNENICYVSRKPVEIHFDEDGKLHNDRGMSCRFADNYGIYTLHGTPAEMKNGKIVVQT